MGGLKVTPFDRDAQNPLSSSSGGTGTPMGGDTSGTFPNPTVTGIQGRPVCVTAPTTGQTYVWDGTQWCPGSVAAVLEVKETDGTPDVTGVSVVQVPPGGLTNNTGGNVTLEYVPDRNGAIENLRTVTTSGAAQALDWSSYNEFDITLTANCTISFSNVPNVSGKGAAITIVLRQDGTGSRTVTWPGTVSWVTGSAPVLKTAAAGVDVITIFTTDGGTSFGGAAVGQGTSPLTTKGDLFGYSTTNARLPVGTDGYVPTADSTASLGITYKDPTLTVGASDHAHVVSETHLSDGSTTTWTLDQVFMSGSVIAWNTTTLARLGVTEVPPDQATVSAAGTSGDSIVFDYAAIVV